MKLEKIILTIFLKTIDFSTLMWYNHMTQEQSLEACSDYYAERDKKDLEIHN